jgi:hypothetical protein
MGREALLWQRHESATADRAIIDLRVACGNTGLVPGRTPRPELLERARAWAGILPHSLPSFGYDHSSCFASTFMENHLCRDARAWKYLSLAPLDADTMIG